MFFPVNFVKFLRTPFLQNTSGRLLLYIKFGAETWPRSLSWYISVECLMKPYVMASYELQIIFADLSQLCHFFVECIPLYILKYEVEDLKKVDI